MVIHKTLSLFLLTLVLPCWGAGSTTFSYRHDHELPLVVLICSYNNAEWVNKNLDSVFCQHYANYRILYIDDCSEDSTTHEVQSYKKQYDTENKLTLITNTQRHRKMKNMYNAVHACHDYEIIVQLDGDDWFCDNYLFARINHLYQTKDIWLTYGSYIDVPGDIRGYAQETDPETIKDQSYRNKAWLYMPTRTFYAWLFKAIALKDFIAERVKNYQGLFFPSADDPAFMFPMLEMAGTRFAYVDHISYVANRANPIIGRTIEPDLQGACGCDIRYRKPYHTLDNIPSNTQRPTSCDMLIFADNNPQNLEQLIDSIEQYATGINRIIILSDTAPISMHTDSRIQWYTCSQLETCLAHITDYVLIANDAVYLEHSIDLATCLYHLEKTKAFGFYFAYSPYELPFYDTTTQNTIINVQHVYDDIYAWKFNCGNYAFFNNYDMTLLRKTDVIKQLGNCVKYKHTPTIAELKNKLYYNKAINLHDIGLIKNISLINGTITSINITVPMPEYLDLPPGRGYRTPMDIERKRCRKMRLQEERELKAAGKLHKERRIKKKTIQFHS